MTIFCWTTEHRACMIEALDYEGFIEVRAPYILQEMVEAGLAKSTSNHPDTRGRLTQEGSEWARDQREDLERRGILPEEYLEDLKWRR